MRRESINWRIRGLKLMEVLQKLAGNDLVG
jgi:hypothetical protein